MKILHISNSLIPSLSANGIQVMKMCSSLSKLGHDVCLLAHVGQIDIDPFKFYGVDSTFKINFIKKSLFLKILIYIYKIFRFKPDVVYARSFYGACVSALFGFSVIFELHSDSWRSGIFAPLLYKYLNSNKKIKKIIFITNALMESYMSDWPMSRCRNFQVLPDGADLNFEQTCDEYRLVEKLKGDFKVGYVGGLYHGKGVEVVQGLAPILSDMTFHIIGGNEEQVEEWRSKIKEENVVFHGFVAPGEAAMYCAQMDVCLLPNQRSVRCYGGNDGDIAKYTSPLKMFEYMALGKPIIASDLPVIREVLSHEINSLLCSPESVDEWRSSLVRLRAEPELREKISSEAKELFIRNYTWKDRARKLLN